MLSFKTVVIKVIVLMNILAISGFAVETPELPIIEKAADFKLINQDHQEISLSQFQGKVKVVTFIYVRCHQAAICPLTTKNFKKLQDSLVGDLDKNTVILSISFDTESDTPAVLKKYAQLYDVDFHNWHFLTGDKTTIEKVCQDYKFIAEKQADGTFRHSAITFLIDQDNYIRKIYFANAWTPEEIKQDIVALLLPKKDAQ
ncbi:MAG: SCO family protein [Candidatus Omnitrophota bacterium]